MQSAMIWMMLTAFGGQGGTSVEICVEHDRANRLAAQDGQTGRGLAAPEAVVRARDYLSRDRVPLGEFEVADFLGWLPDHDAHPTGEALAVHIASAVHPSDASRALVRLAVTTDSLKVKDPVPVHLLVLVNVASTMQSVPTRSYPLLGDQLPELGSEDFYFKRVDRLALTRSILHGVVKDLPADTVVALAAFNRGAAVALAPTSVSKIEKIQAAIDTLTPGLITDGERGLDLMVGMVEQMRSFCGDTHIIVISDGPTGLGGDPEEALFRLSEQASHGVTLHTLIPAIGLRRVPQLERLAWVGYGGHHYVDTLGDGIAALQLELADGRTAVRDLVIDVQFDDTVVVSAQRVGDERPWLETSLPHDAGREVLYEVQFREGQDARNWVQASWKAGSPVPGEWVLAGTASLGVSDLRRVFRDATPNLRMAWVAASFAEALNNNSDVDLERLYDMAAKARRDGVTQDVELMGLIDRFKRVVTE